MKRLLITSTDLMMIQFLVPHVLFLREQGYYVDVACSEVGGRLGEVRKILGNESVYQIHLARSPLKPNNILGLRDLKALIRKGKYDIIWTNEPVMGIMTRCAAKITKGHNTKLLYMVHGFHFFDGAPKLNWILWYPIEKIMARYCDLLVTVNNEDYQRAQSMPYPTVKYIHGIGINTARLTASEKTTDIRAELGLPENAPILIAVGELNKNKNQQVLIRALSKVSRQSCHLLICGKGAEKSNLEALVQECDLNDRVHLLGYRNDVVNLVKQSDIFLMSSFREGLPVASLEAMYCGVPLITSRCRGLVDIMKKEEERFLCDPTDEDSYAKAIDEMLSYDNLRSIIQDTNRQTVQAYLIENTKVEILKVIDGLNNNR